MRLAALIGLALALLGSPIAAQKNCTKGTPCGKTCISASKVCRVGSPNGGGSSAAAPANSGPSCLTGIPCGNSCISADKVSRIGPAPTATEGKGSPTAAQPRDERGRYIRSQSARARFMRLTGYSSGRGGYVVDHVNFHWPAAARTRLRTCSGRRSRRRRRRIGSRKGVRYGWLTLRRSKASQS